MTNIQRYEQELADHIEDGGSAEMLGSPKELRKTFSLYRKDRLKKRLPLAILVGIFASALIFSFDKGYVTGTPFDVLGYAVAGPPFLPVIIPGLLLKGTGIPMHIRSAVFGRNDILSFIYPLGLLYVSFFWMLVTLAIPSLTKYAILKRNSQRSDRSYRS